VGAARAGAATSLAARSRALKRSAQSTFLRVLPFDFERRKAHETGFWCKLLAFLLALNFQGVHFHALNFAFPLSPAWVDASVLNRTIHR